MKIRFESNDDLPLDKILSILSMIIDLFFKKTRNIIHKFVYMNLCMNLEMNYKEYAILVQ